MKFTAEELEQIRAVVMAPFQRSGCGRITEDDSVSSAFNAACG
jgi:hypothetical protein